MSEKTKYFNGKLSQNLKEKIFLGSSNLTLLRGEKPKNSLVMTIQFSVKTLKNILILVYIFEKTAWLSENSERILSENHECILGENSLKIAF